MTSRNNPSPSPAEMAELLRQFSGVGVELAEFSLENLETRLEGDEINRERLENLTDAERAEFMAIGERFALLLQDAPTIAAYTLSQFQADFGFIAEFFNAPLKTEIETQIAAVDASRFAEIQAQMGVRATERRTEALRSASEHLALLPDNLNNQQRNLLRNIPNIGVLTEQVAEEMEAAGQSLESPEAMERLIELVTNQVYNELTEVFNTNMQLINQVQQQQNQEDLNAQISEQLDIDVEGVVGANNLTEQFGNLSRSLVGMGGYVDINQNPLITSVLTPEARAEFNQLFIAAAGESGTGVNIPSGIREMVATNVREILTGANLTDVMSHFHRLHTEPGSHENPEVIRRSREIMVAKLRTVPREWQNTVEAERYEEYVLQTGVDAFDFEGAMERGYLGEVSFLRKMIMMFKGLWHSVIGAFAGEEDSETWERIEHYSGEGYDPDGNEEDPLLGEDREDAQRMYESLASQAREAGFGELNILDNGEPFSPSSAEDLAALESISRNFSFQQHPDRLRILTLGIEISDLYVLAENNGDLRGEDGFNVDFTEDGFSMNLDMENSAWRYLDDVLVIGGGMALTAWMVSNPAGWFTALGFALKVGAGGALAGGLNEFINLDEFIEGRGESFEYDNFSPVEFRAALENIQARAGLIEEAFNNIDPERIGGYIENFESHAHRFDMENISNFPADMFDENGISPAFQSLLALDDEFWQTEAGEPYVMTQADLEAFASNLDHGTFSWGYVDNEAAAFEANDAWNPIRRWRGGFMVEGGTLMDHRFDNVQDFFEWLRS